MVQTCIVNGCKSEWSPGSEIKFHVFPKETKRKEAWLAIVPLKSKFYNSAKICSLHFKQDDYDCSGKKLKQTAIPFSNENTEEVMEIDESISSLSEPPSLSCTTVDPLEHDSYSQPLDDFTEHTNKNSLLRRLLETSQNDRVRNSRPYIEDIAPMSPVALQKINRSTQVKIKSDREGMLQKRNRILTQKVNRYIKYMTKMKSLLATAKFDKNNSEIEKVNEQQIKEVNSSR